MSFWESSREIAIWDKQTMGNCKQWGIVNKSRDQEKSLVFIKVVEGCSSSCVAGSRQLVAGLEQSLFLLISVSCHEG